MQGELVLDRYEIIRHIGGGGMAQVYLADDRLEPRRVAVKVMNTEHTRKSRSVERFRREGRLLCRLNHPNLVHGITQGEHNGLPVIIMEYVDGPSIEELIRKRGALSPQESLKLLCDIALALNHLFVEGHIQAHRDIKPTNVLVDSDGAAKLMDFGISKALDESEGITLTSTFLGSPHYMAPEQILDPRSADIRTDLYALGAVFYEMLTGDKAYPGNGTKEILDAHFDLEAPAFETDSALGPVCNEVLVRTLAERPEDRFQTPRGLLELIVPAVGGDVRIAVPRFARSSLRFAAAVATLTLLTTAAIAFVVSANVEPVGQQPPAVADDPAPRTTEPASIPLGSTAATAPPPPSMGSVVPERSSGGVNVGGTSGIGATPGEAAARALDD